MVTLHFEIIARLEIEPEAIAGAEVPSEAQRGIGADRASAVDDFVDPAGGTLTSCAGNTETVRAARESPAARISPA